MPPGSHLWYCTPRWQPILVPTPKHQHLLAPTTNWQHLPVPTLTLYPYTITRESFPAVSLHSQDHCLSHTSHLSIYNRPHIPPRPPKKISPLCCLPSEIWRGTRNGLPHLSSLDHCMPAMCSEDCTWQYPNFLLFSLPSFHVTGLHVRRVRTGIIVEHVFTSCRSSDAIPRPPSLIQKHIKALSESNLACADVQIPGYMVFYKKSSQILGQVRTITDGKTEVP